jgi:hypothetical protein
MAAGDVPSFHEVPCRATPLFGHCFSVKWIRALNLGAFGALID